MRTLFSTLCPPGTRRELSSHGSLHLTPSHCLVTQVFEVQRQNFASTPDQVSNSLLVKIPALPCTRQTHLRRFCTKNVFYSRAKKIASARPLCFSCALPKIMQALNCPAHPSFDLFSAKTPVLPFILWSLKYPAIHPVMVAISFTVKHLQYEQKLPLNTTEEYPDIRPKKNEEIYIIYKARQVTMKNW